VDLHQRQPFVLDLCSDPLLMGLEEAPRSSVVVGPMGADLLNQSAMKSSVS